MKSRAPAIFRAGFTLIELVLALAIAGVVLTAVSSVFFAALRLRTTTVKMAEQNMPVDRAVEIIKRDLADIMPPGIIPGVMATDATLTGVTQPLILELYTSDNILRDDVPWSDQQKIDYYLQDPTNRNSGAVGKDLIRGVTQNLLSPTPIAPTPERLLGGVQSLRFSYYDGTNWNDAWSGQLSNTPIAIKGFLTLVQPKGDAKSIPPIQFYVPVVMQAQTNLASATNSSNTNSATD
jgi:prepilin-type N-terminal cleavage/methylation domain-containing protein